MSGEICRGGKCPVHDLKTMEEVDSTRLTSLERVTTGVGSVSRAARIEADSHCRLLRPTLLDDVVSMIFYRKFTTYLTQNRYQIATKITTLLEVNYETNSTFKTWELGRLAKNGNCSFPSPKPKWQ